MALSTNLGCLTPGVGLVAHDIAVIFQQICFGLGVEATSNSRTDFIEIKSLSSRALLCLSMKFLLLMVDGVFTKCIFCPSLWKYQLTISIGSSGKRLALTASTWCDQPLMQHHATLKWLKWQFYGYTLDYKKNQAEHIPLSPYDIPVSPQVFLLIYWLQ